MNEAPSGHVHGGCTCITVSKPSFELLDDYYRRTGQTAKLAAFLAEHTAALDTTAPVAEGMG